MDDGQNYRTEHNLDLTEAHKCIRKFNFKNITIVLNNFLLYNKNKIIQKKNEIAKALIPNSTAFTEGAALSNSLKFLKLIVLRKRRWV